VGCRAATVGGQRRLRQPPTGRTAGPAPTLADRGRPKPTRSAVLPVGAARHSLVLLVLGGKGPRSAAEWPAPWKRSFCASTQDRNGTVSCRCSPSAGFFRPGVGFGRPQAVVLRRRSRCRGSVCCRRFLCGQVEWWGPAGSGELHSVLFRAGQLADTFPPRRVPRLSGDPGQRTNVLYTHHPPFLRSVFDAT
jgi:hypothetical protein